MSLSYAVLKKQDDQTSNAILNFLANSAEFKALSEAEGVGIMKRDQEDETKLAAGIEIAVKKGVLQSNPSVADVVSVNVVGKTADAVAEEILSALPGKNGNVIVLQGLSGTGKGTTVKKLQALLPNCVTWSNGNVFRTFTHLSSLVCDQQKKEFSSEVLTAALLDQLSKKISFKKFEDGQFDMLIEGEGRMSTIVNTKLKMPHISARVPTVAEQTQGEVVKFAVSAIQMMQADGCNVILEGRKQTLNYIPTPSRFELVIDDASLLGSRRAAQRVMAASLELPAKGDKTTNEQTGQLVLKALKNLCAELPKKSAKTKAAEGAALAAKAALDASQLQNKTRCSIDAAHLQDLTVPCVPLSPIGYALEEAKLMTASAVTTSPWYTYGAQVSKLTPLNQPRPPATYRGYPAAADDKQFHELLDGNLRSLSAGSQPLTMETALIFEQIFGNKQCKLDRLDLTKALDSTSSVELSKPLLTATIEEVEKEIGPEENPDNVEKLQAAVEKLKQEFTTYEAGIEILAKKRLDRMATLFNALQVNTSLKELILSNNNLGASADGRAQFNVLRRLAKVLDVNTTLNKLDLSGNGSGPQGTGLIAKAMCKNISVHSLDLSGNDIVGDTADEDEDPDQEEEDPIFGDMLQGLEALSEVIKKNKFLKCLCLRGNRIKAEIDEAGEDDGVDTAFGKFLEPFKKYHRLEILDLSGNELGAGGAKMLANALELNKGITVLDVSDNQLGPKGLTHLTRLLRGSKSLKQLMIQKNELKGKKGKRAQKEALEAMTDFANAVQVSSFLKVLNISSNHLGVEFSEVMLNGVFGSQLETLYFNSNDLCGSCVGEFYPNALDKLVSGVTSEDSLVTELHINGNFIQAKGCKLLTRSPKTLAGMKFLDLSRNAIGNEGLEQVANHMASGSCTLEELELSHNNIESIGPLVLPLRNCNSVKRLHLGNNNIGVGKVDQLRQLLDILESGRTKIEVMDIQGNQLNSEHGAMIASICKTATPPLRTLNIYNNPNISLAETQKIFIALASNRAFEGFDISSQAGDHQSILQALAATLETNTTLMDVDFCMPQDEGFDDPTLPNKLRLKLLQNALKAGK